MDFYAGIIELGLAFSPSLTISVFKIGAVNPCTFNVIIDMLRFISKGQNSNLCTW